MSEYQHPGPEQPDERRPEQAPVENPRIYVADLAAYTNGELHGIYVDATDDLDAMQEQIAAMLAHSPIPFAEEFAIHDYENFGPVRLSEYESIETVARIGRGFVEHGEAFLHWVAYVGTSDREALGRFEDYFLGAYQSLGELGEELADSHGMEQLLDEHLPEFIRSYVSVDYQALGADMASGVHQADGDGTIYLFDP